MRFEIPKCPECGGPPIGTVDTIPGLALLRHVEDGLFEWEGETKVFWDGQQTDYDDNGDPILQCANDHTWASPCDEIRH